MLTPTAIRADRSDRSVASVRFTRARAIAALAIALCTSGCGGDSIDLTQPPVLPASRPVLPSAYRATGHAAAGDVFVHLFEWPWVDIAQECRDVLGPDGVRAVQVSPPQEHVVLASAPWWQRYQPVSYSIDRSRSGTRAEFVAMVAACRAAGVDIYVDAVINHMTAGGGTGSSGTVYSKYSYPGLYGSTDFRAPCGVSDYQSAQNVQDCELLGLAELNTALPSVQQKIADYLIALVRLGVAGFRIDAAKHMQPVELDAIIGRVNQAASAEGLTRPYVFSEVIDYGGEAVRVSDYFGLGFASGGASDITEFKYRGIGNKFLGINGEKVADLSRFSAGAWNLMASDKAVVFVENHDTQRSDGISYRESAAYRLANVWMLAHAYGYPSIMSSYAFDRGSASGRDRGPPSGGDGITTRVACASSLETAVVGQWVCEHRDPVIRGMIGFRRAVAGADVSRQWDNGGHAVAFSRGARGFVAINRETTPLSATITSGLPPGEYCDVMTGGLRGNSCAGAAITVAADGSIALTLASASAVAIHQGTRR